MRMRSIGSVVLNPQIVPTRFLNGIKIVPEGFNLRSVTFEFVHKVTVSDHTEPLQRSLGKNTDVENAPSPGLHRR